MDRAGGQGICRRAGVARFFEARWVGGGGGGAWRGNADPVDGLHAVVPVGHLGDGARVTDARHPPHHLLSLEGERFGGVKGDGDVLGGFGLDVADGWDEGD